MMKKNYALLLILQLLFTTHIMAQEVKTPTLDDLIPGGETYLYPHNLYGLQWWGDECIRPDIDTLYAIHPQTGKERVITTRQIVNKALSKAQADTLQQFYDITFPHPDKAQMLMELSGEFLLFDFKNNQIVSTAPFEKGAANKEYSPAGGNVAYTIGNNLYVNRLAVTNEPEGVVCGQSVHRKEFGIRKGTFWSPKGNWLAFYRMDESMVAQYPLVDTSAPIGELNNIRYPMAGATSHKVSVGIYHPLTQQTIYLHTGDVTDRYFTNISWAPDEKSLYMIELNRDQNHAKLCQYSVESGELMATLFEETHPKYVEPQHPIVFLPWDNQKFIYQSQRNGFNHLYLYNTQGTLLKPLTQGNWLVSNLLGFNASRKEVIFTATDINGSRNYSVQVNSTKQSLPLSSHTTTQGVHTGKLSASGTYLIDRYSTPTVPRSIDIINTQTMKSSHLFTAANPYEGFTMPIIETGTIKAADGATDLCYRIIKPADFDPSKKYPAIVYVYGGPHAQIVTQEWLNGARGWDLYMANKGYILFSLDNRGSENRGLEFENITFRQLGIEEGKDQLKGTEFLKSLPYIDGNRVGVHGWSFGGHMTIGMMLRYPEVFKVGVAGGAVTDWSYYEAMYGERYMDTPQSNPEGYQQSNLKNLAGELKGHLLLIHDDHDNTCVPQHTLSFIKACVDARTYPDLFIYPGHQHNVLGRDRIHLHEKITRYFEQHL